MGNIVMLLVMYLAVAAGHPALATEDDDAKCRKVKADIRHVQSRLRAGYTRAEGEKLEARLTKLRDKRRKVCR